MPLNLIAGPQTEPVTTGQAQTHLRLAASTDDEYVGTLVTVARQYVEHITGRALVSQTWELVLDAFPSGEIALDKGRVSSVTSFTYYDADGASQTLDASQYQVDTDQEPGRVVLAPGCSWPETQEGKIGAVRIQYVVGYGDATAVPKPLVQALLLLVGHLYENREMEIVGPSISKINFALEALTSPYRMTWVG